MRGEGGRHFAFAGHLDVVPPGTGWTSGAFTPEIRGGLLHGRGAVEQGHVQPLRLERRPPAQPGGLAVLLVQGERLRLRDRALPRRDAGRTQPLAAQGRRVVEVDELGVVGELELRERERQPAPAQEGFGEPLPAEARKLLDDARKGLLGEIEAAVHRRIVVTTLALVRPREPESAVRGIRRGALLYMDASDRGEPSAQSHSRCAQSPCAVHVGFCP